VPPYSQSSSQRRVSDPEYGSTTLFQTLGNYISQYSATSTETFIFINKAMTISHLAHEYCLMYTMLLFWHQSACMTPCMDICNYKVRVF